MKKILGILTILSLVFLVVATTFPGTTFQTIQFRRGTSTEWVASNPVLSQGEPGYETNTKKFKIGDGLTHWNNLPYTDSYDDHPQYPTLSWRPNDYFSDFKTIGPWIDSRAYPTLTLVEIDSIAFAAGKLLVVSQNYTIAVDTVLTASIMVIPGGSFTKASTYTLTFSGSFKNSSNRQCFIGFAVGDITFGSGSIDKAYAEWWGIDGTADEVQINMALAAFYKVALLEKTYTLGATISGIRNGSILEGVGRHGTVLSPSAQTFPAITVTGTIVRWRVSDLQISYSLATGGARANNANAIGIKIAGTSSLYPYMFSIRDVAIYYSYNGFYSADYSFMFDLTNVYVSEVGDYGIKIPHATVGTTITMNNVFVNAGLGGFKISNIHGLVMTNCGSDNIDKGQTINILTGCSSMINYFNVEGCTLGNYMALFQISGGSAEITAYRASTNIYDEDVATESYGLRVDSLGDAIIRSPINYGETHIGAGISYALLGTSSRHILVLGHDITAPVGGTTHGIYKGGNEVSVFNDHNWEFYGSISSPKIITFTSTDATPSVADGNIFKTANSGATVITTFHDGIVGQEILIIFTDAFTTIAETDNIKLSAAFTSTVDDTMKLVFDGTSWYEI